MKKHRYTPDALHVTYHIVYYVVRCRIRKNSISVIILIRQSCWNKLDEGLRFFSSKKSHLKFNGSILMLGEFACIIFMSSQINDLLFYGCIWFAMLCLVSASTEICVNIDHISSNFAVYFILSRLKAILFVYLCIVCMTYNLHQLPLLLLVFCSWKP